MHVVLIPHPALRLSAYLALFTFKITLGDQMGGEVIDQIFDDEPRFGEYNRLRSVGRLDSDDGGFAQWVDIFELRRCQHVLSFERLDVIFYVCLFQKP